MPCRKVSWLDSSAVPSHCGFLLGWFSRCDDGMIELGARLDATGPICFGEILVLWVHSSIVPRCRLEVLTGFN